MDKWYFPKGSVLVKEFSEEAIPAGGFVWLNGSTSEINEVLTTIKILTGSEFHEEHLTDCLNAYHPPFFDSMSEYDFLILRNLLPESNAHQLLTEPVFFIFYNNLIVTIHNHCNIIENYKSIISNNRTLLPKTQEGFIYHLIIRVIDNFQTLRKSYIETSLQWQKHLLSDDGDDKLPWEGLMQYRSSIQELNALCDEQLDAITQWAHYIVNEENDHFSAWVTDIHEHIKRILTFTEQQERQIDSLMQLHYLKVGNKTNQIMRIFTVISGTFLPLMAITSFFGMNFEKMPLIHSFYGFLGTCSLMAVVVFSLLFTFRRKKWI